jgi:hypothetical protein
VTISCRIVPRTLPEMGKVRLGVVTESSVSDGIDRPFDVTEDGIDSLHCAHPLCPLLSAVALGAFDTTLVRTLYAFCRRERFCFTVFSGPIWASIRS